jgi:predicted transcriptional regulator
MTSKKTSQPTERELTILRILWQIGPATVKEVNKKMAAELPTGYTTTLKLMQIMTEKHLLKRDDSSFRHIFSPAVTEENAQNQIVRQMMDKVFAGSAEKLVMRALSAKKISKTELKKIKKMLENFKGE